MISEKARRTQKVGDLGEDDFKRWCTLNELSAVKAAPDRMGWDYLVEFEPVVDNAIPLDRQTDLKKVLVQIKATDKKSDTARGKLSAFKKLVDADLPAFVLHMDYSGKTSPKLARLLHVGATQIEAVLRRVRQAEKEGRFDIHNIQLALALDEATEVTLDGTNLRSLILAAMPSSGAEYVIAKAALRRRCGFDERSIKAHFTLAPGQDEEALVDLLIGKVPHLAVSEMVVNKTRFGIELDKDIDRVENATLTVEVKPFGRGSLVVTSPHSQRRVEMAADIYGAGMPNLPERLRRIRLANDFVELDVRFALRKTQFGLSIDPLKSYSIETLATVIAFGATLAHDDAELEIRIGDRSAATLKAPPEAKYFVRWRVMDEFTDLLSTALVRHRRGTIFEITMRDLERMLDVNKNMFALLKRPGMEMTFGANPDLPPTFPRHGWFYCPIGIEFGSFVYTAVIRAQTEKFTVAEDGSIQVVGGLPHVVWDGISDCESFKVADLNARANELSRGERSEGEFVITTTLGDPDDAPSISDEQIVPAHGRSDLALPVPGRRTQWRHVEARED